MTLFEIIEQKKLQREANEKWLKTNKPWYFSVPFTEFPSCEDFKPSRRSVNCLTEKSINNFDDFLKYDLSDMLEFKDMGGRSVDEIVNIIPKIYGGVFSYQIGDLDFMKERIAAGNSFWVKQTQLADKYNPNKAEKISPKDPSVAFINNAISTLSEAEGEVSFIQTIPENILDLTSNLKAQLQAQGYKVEAQLKITKLEH